jgi:hypothetical protein
MKLNIETASLKSKIDKLREKPDDVAVLLDVMAIVE